MERQRALILLGLRTGLRLKVLLSLRIQDVSIDGRICNPIRVREIKNNRCVSSFKLCLHHQAAEALQQYLDIRKGRIGYVFNGRTRKPMSPQHGYVLIKDAFRRAGLIGGSGEIAAHTLRKTLARLAFEALEHDLVRTSYALRNVSITSTINYLSFEERVVNDAILSI